MVVCQRHFIMSCQGLNRGCRRSENESTSHENYWYSPQATCWPPPTIYIYIICTCIYNIYIYIIYIYICFITHIYIYTYIHTYYKTYIYIIIYIYICVIYYLYKDSAPNRGWWWLMGAFSSGYLLSSMTPQCHPFGGHRLIYTRPAKRT